MGHVGCFCRALLYETLQRCIMFSYSAWFRGFTVIQKIVATVSVGHGFDSHLPNGSSSVRLEQQIFSGCGFDSRLISWISSSIG